MLCFFIYQSHVKADYVVLSSGTVLEGENIHRVQSIASISKVMTALVALEYGNISDFVTVDQKTTQQIGSSLYLKENETYSLLSLLYGLMLRSGNDAAYLISVHVGGNEKRFVELMNEKAKELKMVDTHFSNPSGLDEFDEGNQSSVYDMALCMQEAMKNEVFRTIVNTLEYRAENQRIWTNKNRLLRIYDSCNGGKTGYTTQSGKTLITSASEDHLESIVVSFREDDYFMLHKKLHENVYEKYETVLLIQKGHYKIANKKIMIEEDIYALVLKNEKPFVKIIKDQDGVLIQYKNLDQMMERKERFH